jgi:osmotically-inducible protein OsmY
MPTAEKIKKDIIDNLYWDTRVDASDINVEVEDGQVTLTGTVPSYTSRNAATTSSWSISGVQSVDNQLIVEYPAEITIPSDDEIKGNIESSLVWDTDIDSSDINVTVENNEVTLEGTVDAYWKKYRAANLADVTGVYDVINDITVVPTKNHEDEVIAKAVMNALIRNFNVDEKDVEVEVENGIVTIRGEASSWLEYKSASESAYFTAGVREVENLMQINY